MIKHKILIEQERVTDDKDGPETKNLGGQPPEKDGERKMGLVTAYVRHYAVCTDLSNRHRHTRAGQHEKTRRRE
jgi:hypothetical protein